MPEKLAAERTACTGGGDNLENCMSAKGYVLVRDDEIAAKVKEFAEAAEKKQQEQAALAAAEKKKQQALRKTAAHTKKPKAKIATPATTGDRPASAVQAGPRVPYQRAPARRHHGRRVALRARRHHRGRRLAIRNRNPVRNANWRELARCPACRRSRHAQHVTSRSYLCLRQPSCAGRNRPLEEPAYLCG